MNEDILSSRKYKEHYLPLLEKYGNSAEGVDWRSEKEEIVFSQFKKLLPNNESFTINDLGCGNSRFLNYLIQNNYSFNYIGYDILEEMISKSRDYYPEHKFVKINDSSELKLSDYSIGSGILHLKYDMSEEEFKSLCLNIIDNLNSFSKKGFAFNGLVTPYGEYETRNHLYYWDTDWLLSYLEKKYTFKLNLYKGYFGLDFTVIIEK